MLSPIVLVVVDGLSLSLFDRVLSLIDLPTLAGLRDEGILVQLQGPIHPSEPAVWADFLTGSDAGLHGIADGLQRELTAYRFGPARARHLKTATFWQVAARHGRRIGVLNAPLLYPPVPTVQGYLVAGNDAPGYDSPFTYPNGLAPLLAQKLGQSYHFDRELEKDTLEESIAFTGRLLQARLDSYFLLAERFRGLDLHLVVFSALGKLLVYFYAEIEEALGLVGMTASPAWLAQFLAVFRQLDSFVDRVSQQSNREAAVILLSTWSVGPLSGIVSMNEWLLDNRYLALEPGAGIDTFPEGIDWSRTLAYAPGPWGSVYLNLRGREPEGIVEPGQEAAHLRRRLGDELLQLQDGTKSERLVSQLYTSEDLYNGPFWSEAPDLNMVVRDYSYLTGQYPGSGSPRPHGFAAIRSRDVSHRTLPDHSLKDLAPTLLHLLDLPIPGRMRGGSFGSEIADLPPPTIEMASVSECASISCLSAHIQELERRRARDQAVFDAALANDKQELAVSEAEVANARNIIKQYESGRVMRLLNWLTRWKRRLLRRESQVS